MSKEPTTNMDAECAAPDVHAGARTTAGVATASGASELAAAASTPRVKTTTAGIAAAITHATSSMRVGAR
jgi:hypothetical protein